MTEEKHKRCFKCGETKPLSDFYKHHKMADGHVNKCKECNKKDVRENRNDNIEYIRDYDRKRSRLKEGNRYETRVKYTKNIPDHVKEKRAEYLRQRRLKFPERYKANTALHNAVKSGKLNRPNNCEFCGKECKPEAHHSSYSEDMWLAVTWLCTSCHGEVHRLYD